ncbi:MAG: DUF4926 domain-containing protein [Ignavibacteriaceae bacterium]
MEEIKCFDLIYLKENLSLTSLMKGLTGTVIYIYKPNKLFEVEFICAEGNTIASLILEKNQIKKLNENDIQVLNKRTLFLRNDEQLF